MKNMNRLLYFDGCRCLIRADESNSTSESDSVVEVNIHRFEVIGVGMVVLCVFLICREH